MHKGLDWKKKKKRDNVGAVLSEREKNHNRLHLISISKMNL